MRTKIVCELSLGNKNVRIHMDNQLKSYLRSISIFDTTRKLSANSIILDPKLFRLIFFSLFFLCFSLFLCQRFLFRTFSHTQLNH